MGSSNDSPLDMIRFADVIITPLILSFYSWVTPTKSISSCTIQRLIVGVRAGSVLFLLSSLFGLTALQRARIVPLLRIGIARCGSQEALRGISSLPSVAPVFHGLL